MRRFLTAVLAILTLIATMAGASRPSNSEGKHSVRPTSKARTKTPEKLDKPYQIGKASWYGRPFHGRTTANGETYDMYQLTAAHPQLPLGTWVKVTNLRTGKSVLVRINDRGPMVEGRIIDLSFEAALAIGLNERGVERVRLDLANPVTIATALN